MSSATVRGKIWIFLFFKDIKDGFLNVNNYIFFISEGA